MDLALILQVHVCYLMAARRVLLDVPMVNANQIHPLVLANQLEQTLTNVLMVHGFPNRELLATL
jgi:hypothetical protein